MKQIKKIFNSNEVRCFIKNKQPYFSITDICNVLGLSNSSVVASQLKKDYLSTTYVIDSMKREQEIIIVNEYGLYEIIFKSRKEEAKRFKEWIFEDVLPSIRKTGKYSITDELKQISTKNRNILTTEWKKHGINKPHHFIQLTLQEYKSIGIDKKKNEMSEREILLLSALESMESLKLFDNMNINGYYECKESIYNTGSIINNSIPDIIKQEQLIEVTK